MPAKLHITVLKSFRRHSKIPKVLVIHRGDLAPQEIEEREGYCVTKPMRTIIDLIIEESISIDLVRQAFKEAKQRGLLQIADVERYRKNSEIGLKIKECLGKLA